MFNAFISLAFMYFQLKILSSQIMVGTSSGWIATFDLETGTYLPNTWNSNPSSSVNSIKLLDANTLVSASSDKTLTVWNLTVSSPTVISTFTSHTDAVNRVDKLANGNVVSVGVDKTLYIWNPITGSMVTNRYSAHSTTILSLKVLSSGYIATGGALGDNTVKIWDISMLGSPKKTLNGHSNNVTAIEELSTGNLISGSLDTYAIVWNSSFAQINKFQALNGINITCIKELSDGSIAFAGYDHSIYIWKITGLGTQSLVSVALNIIYDVLPCNQIMLYNSSMISVATSGLNTIMISIDYTNYSLSAVKNLTLANSFSLCLENQGRNSTTTTSTSTTTTTTTTTSLATSSINATTTSSTTITTINSTTTTSTTNTSLATSTIANTTTTSISSSSTTTTNSTNTTISTLTSSISTSITPTQTTQINSSMSNITNIFSGYFSVSDLTIQQYLLILNSNYDISDCLVNCSNNGLCKYGGNYTFICMCQQYYKGQTCQKSILPCSYNPCLNNASCYQNITDSEFGCECSMYYYGSKCEYKIDVCENETCSNNGYCRDVNHLPICECFYMYSGNRCEIESAQKRAYQVIISTSSIIAISTVVAFYCLLLLNDVVSCLTNKATKNKKKAKIVHNKYIP